MPSSWSWSLRGLPGTVPVRHASLGGTSFNNQGHRENDIFDQSEWPIVEGGSPVLLDLCAVGA
jgi:hypothetical protein